MADKLELKTILAAIDMGSKESWDEFSDEEKKSVGFFLLNRYVSNVKTNNQDLAEHYLILVNEFVNKNFGVITEEINTLIPSITDKTTQIKLAEVVT